MSRSLRHLAVIAVWVLTIPLCIAFVDRPAARFAHANLAHHDIFRRLTLLPQLLAPISFVLLIVLGLAALRRPLRGTSLLLLLASLSMVIADALDLWLKGAFGRTWPETWVHGNPSFIANHVYGFFPFHGGAGWASFPSGHMAAICGFCSPLWFLAPHLRPVWLVLMGLVAVGLYGMDYHFVSDMIAGTGLGFAVGLVTVRLAGPRGRVGR
jgi:membrane-associated phospholipid phosphatase